MRAQPDGFKQKALGRTAEDAAAQFLASQGYKVVGRNVRPLPALARGELDIVAWDGDILCFIEVKARTSTRGPDPDISVSESKRNQLMTLALAYMSVNQIEPESCRFDVVSVWISPALPSPQLVLHKDAFEAS